MSQVNRLYFRNWCGVSFFGATILLAVSVFAENGTGINETQNYYVPWLEMLDSDSSQRRSVAWNQLSNEIGSLKVSQELEKSTKLLYAVRERLRKPEISYEAQYQLGVLEQRILSQMEASDVEKLMTSVEIVASNELDKLACWQELFSDIPTRRSWAQREIENRIASGQDVDVVMRILREIVVENEISGEERQCVWKLEKKARSRWLKCGKASESDCGYSEVQIREWIDFLASVNLPEDRLVPWIALDDRVKNQFSVSQYEDPFGGDGLPFLDLRQEKARMDGLKVWLLMQKLEDALISRESATETLKYLNRKLASETVTPTGTILLERLVFLTQPCMAAEYWINGAMHRSQILQIGIPQETSVGTSFFDEYNEQTVHCASGTNLVPGDYPWGVAVAHPNQPLAFFHLEMLDTPEKKLLYSELMTQNKEERWEKVTRNTLEYLEKACQTRKETSNLLRFTDIQLLELLKPQEMSRSVACWLKEWPNKKDWVEEKSQNTFVDTLKLSVTRKQSHHACLCVILGKKGMREAIPGVMEILKKEPLWWEEEFLRFRVDFYAALAMTARDPWDGDEAWLKSLLVQDIKQDIVLEERQTLEDSDSPMRAVMGSNPMIPAGNRKNDVPVVDLPTVAATAAGILLLRRRESVEGLEEMRVSWNCAKELRVFRFKDGVSRKKICEKLMEE
ncbi:MAG: hypothetical protein Q4C70_01700 [Planctomycetia bacterium]|nr:hypothetical protein [Planctomycetia bacterium]